MFSLKHIFSNEADSRNGFSRSRSIGFTPGIMEILWYSMKKKKLRFQISIFFLGRFSYFLTSRRQNCSFLTWKSDSSCPTLYIDPWEWLESQILDHKSWTFFQNMFFFNTITGLVFCIPGEKIWRRKQTNQTRRRNRLERAWHWFR